MWNRCIFCGQMIKDKGSAHECPDAAIIKRDIEIDEEVEKETEFFDLKLDKFWSEPRTMYLEYLLAREKGEAE